MSPPVKHTSFELFIHVYLFHDLIYVFLFICNIVIFIKNLLILFLFFLHFRQNFYLRIYTKSRCV